MSQSDKTLQAGESMNAQTIVIADDDRDCVNLLRKRCESLGMHVRTAFNAIDALILIHKLHPDLICLDVNMPYGSGLSVLEMLANDENLRGTPVIIMTGESDDETIRRCHNLCAYYVEKSSDLWSRMDPLLRELSNQSMLLMDTTVCSNKRD